MQKTKRHTKSTHASTNWYFFCSCPPGLLCDTIGRLPPIARGNALLESLFAGPMVLVKDPLRDRPKVVEPLKVAQEIMQVSYPRLFCSGRVRSCISRARIFHGDMVDPGHAPL